MAERVEYTDAADPEAYDGDQSELAERLALRRVAGMSTQLTASQVEYRDLQLERVVLVGGGCRAGCGRRELMAELRLLAETAGAENWTASSSADRMDAATFVGRQSGRGARGRHRDGRRHRDRGRRTDPAQRRNLHRLQVKVIDRTGLILDISPSTRSRSKARPRSSSRSCSTFASASAGGGNLSRQAGGREAGAPAGGCGP